MRTEFFAKYTADTRKFYFSFHKEANNLYIDVGRFIPKNEIKNFESIIVHFLKQTCSLSVFKYIIIDEETKKNSINILSADGIEPIDFKKFISEELARKSKAIQEKYS